MRFRVSLPPRDGGCRRKRGRSDKRHTSKGGCSSCCCASTDEPGTGRGAKAIGRGQFLLGHQSSRPATSTRPLPPMIVGTPPITTENPSGLQTNMARLLPGGRGVRAGPTMSVSPAGGRHRRAKPSEPRVALGGSPQPPADPLKVAPISLIHSLLIGASGRVVRGTGFAASRVAMRNGRSDTRWPVPP